LGPFIWYYLQSHNTEAVAKGGACSPRHLKSGFAGKDNRAGRISRFDFRLWLWRTAICGGSGWVVRGHPHLNKEQCASTAERQYIDGQQYLNCNNCWCREQRIGFCIWGSSFQFPVSRKQCKWTRTAMHTDGGSADQVSRKEADSCWCCCGSSPFTGSRPSSGRKEGRPTIRIITDPQ